MGTASLVYKDELFVDKAKTISLCWLCDNKFLFQ